MKDFFSSKFAIVLLAIFVVFIGRLKYLQYRQGQFIAQAKRELMEQQLKEEAKNKQLAQSLQILNTPDFKEKIARDQMNMKKEGEIVFNFTEKKGSSLPEANLNPRLSNPQKWWNYFFKNP